MNGTEAAVREVERISGLVSSSTRFADLIGSLDLLDRFGILAIHHSGFEAGKNFQKDQHKNKTLPALSVR